MASIDQDLIPYINDIPSYCDDTFYQFVKDHVGTIEGEILEIQQIKNVRILLRIPNVFAFLDINSKEILELRKQVCFITDDLQYIVRPGVRSNMEQFIACLRTFYESTPSNPNVNSSRAATSNSTNETGNVVSEPSRMINDNESKSFANIFVENLLRNMDRSSNNYRFNLNINKFASACHILAGHHAYEFIRINLPGSLPSITSLKNYNETMNMHLNESEFRFDLLSDYLHLIDSNHVFMVCVSKRLGT